jgi:hypothetical protein
MCKCSLDGENFSIEVTYAPGHIQVVHNFTPNQGLLDCAYGALTAAVTAGISSFIACLSGGAGSAGYNPGNRIRCQ